MLKQKTIVEHQEQQSKENKMRGMLREIFRSKYPDATTIMLRKRRLDLGDLVGALFFFALLVAFLITVAVLSFLASWMFLGFFVSALSAFCAVTSANIVHETLFADKCYIQKTYYDGRIDGEDILIYIHNTNRTIKEIERAIERGQRRVAKRKAKEAKEKAQLLAERKRKHKAVNEYIDKYK